MSRPTREQLAAEVAAARKLSEAFPESFGGAAWPSVVLALADDLVEARALLEVASHSYCRAFRVGGIMTGKCEQDPPCWEHRRRALLERTK